MSSHLCTYGVPGKIEEFVAEKPNTSLMAGIFPQEEFQLPDPDHVPIEPLTPSADYPEEFKG